MSFMAGMGVAARTMSARVLPGRTAPKVFAIGFNKTGTTSLHDIFEEVGLHSYHGTAWRQTGKPAIYYWYDAFCDGVPDDFAKLDGMFPGSKFILQVRNLDEWLDSRLDHIQRLPPEGRRKRPDGWQATDEALKRWVQERQDYHVAVLKHFAPRPDDFLLVNYIREPDSATRIAAFLDHAGTIAKPHSNAKPNADRGLRNSEMISRCLTEMGIPEAEWKNDLLCPSLGGTDGLPADTGAA